MGVHVKSELTWAANSSEAMKPRGWGETSSRCTFHSCVQLQGLFTSLWGQEQPPRAEQSVISEEAAAWCAAVWVQQSLSCSSVCQRRRGWSSAAVSHVVGRPPETPCDGVAPQDPWLVQVSSAPVLEC